MGWLVLQPKYKLEGRIQGPSRISKPFCMLYGFVGLMTFLMISANQCSGFRKFEHTKDDIIHVDIRRSRQMMIWDRASSVRCFNKPSTIYSNYQVFAAIWCTILILLPKLSVLLQDNARYSWGRTALIHDGGSSIKSYLPCQAIRIHGIPFQSLERISKMMELTSVWFFSPVIFSINSLGRHPMFCYSFIKRISHFSFMAPDRNFLDEFDIS